MEALRVDNPSGAMNVAPVVRKYPSIDFADWFDELGFYSPDAVDLRRATGGFSTVVAISAPYCLRMYRSRIETVEVLARRSGGLLEAQLEPLLAKLTDPWWLSFAPSPAEPCAVGYRLEPGELRFSGDDEVTIRFEGSLGLYQSRGQFTLPDIPIPAQADGPFGFPPTGGPVPAPLPIGRAQPDVASGPVGPWAVAAPTATGQGLSVAARLAAYERLINTAGATSGDGGPAASTLYLQHVVGTIEVELTAELRSVGHPPQKSVDVYLDLRAAKVAVKPDAGDASVLYEAFLADLVYELEAVVAPVAQLALTPTISLVGRNAANVNVPEMPDFDVRVFPVTGARGRQALCAAFDVSPGCVGVIEAVDHFIGDSDYGVIRDEYSVERTLHHKWNRGGFDRSLGITRRVALRVKRNGQERDEDAQVYGRLELGSLDTVALEPDPDLRRDFLLLGGRAQGVPDRVVLVADGTTLTPDNADLGPAEPVPWGVNLDATLHPTWSPDPELRQFQQRAHTDGLRHLSRPFARQPEFGGGDVSYIRIEAVQKRFFVLGSLNLFQ